MKALITGIAGQDGAYLAAHLLHLGWDVSGTVRSHAPNLSNLHALGIAGRVRLHMCDVAHLSDCSNLVKMQFDHIYNLAAQSFVGSSWDNPHATTQVNSLGPLNFLHSIHKLGLPTRFYQASTSEMFGQSPGPQDESTPFLPISPYATSKLYGHHIVRTYRESHGVWACSGILFNHESPLRGPQFVTRKITMGIGNILRGRQEHLELGNLDSWRDWGFAGDYVKAMHLMMCQPEPRDYVVATGETHSIREFLDIAADLAGLDPQDFLKINPKFFRPAEVHHLLGNPTKIRGLGWAPSVSFRDLVAMMAEQDYP